MSTIIKVTMIHFLLLMSMISAPDVNNDFTELLKFNLNYSNITGECIDYLYMETQDKNYTDFGLDMEFETQFNEFNYMCSHLENNYEQENHHNQGNYSSKYHYI